MSELLIRDVQPNEAKALGTIMVCAYGALEGFPSVDEQPGYYHRLANIGDYAAQPATRVLVAASRAGALLGGVVYFGDMRQYGAGGAAVQVPNASGIRLLAVAPKARGQGVGKALTCACIELAREAGHRRVILHSTRAMQVAWGMYERLGFKPASEMDFVWGRLPVFGFTLDLDPPMF